MLTITPDELALIGAALGKMSYEQAAPIIGKLTRQVQAERLEAERKMVKKP